MPLQKLCGVWKKQSKSGAVFMSGTIQDEITLPPGTKILIFKNEKQAENQPDYSISFDLGEDQPQQAQRPQQRQPQQQRGQQQRQPQRGQQQQRYQQRPQQQQQQPQSNGFDSEPEDGFEDVPF